MARRPGPSLRAMLFWCGEGAVCEAFGGWKTAETASFLVGSESDVRHWGRPAGPVRPSRPCCFGVAKAPFVKLGGWKTGAAARRPGPFFRALLFWCGEGAVCGRYNIQHTS